MNSCISGAAKIKAFVRQTKQGIDIRLRRKINAEQEEVTDIQLIPNSTIPSHEFHNEKAPLASELPASLNEISELPDTSTPLELDAAPAPSRTSTGESISEPLPKYEPRRSKSDASVPAIDSNGSKIVLTRPPVRSHHHFASQSSIIATPTRGLSLIDHAANDAASDSWSQNESISKCTSIDLLKEDTVDKDRTEAGKSAVEKPHITQSLQTILAALQETHLAADDQVNRLTVKPFAQENFGSFKLAKATTYETETEAEISHPATQQDAERSRKMDIALPRRRKKKITPMSKSSDELDLSLDSDEEDRPGGRGLLRMRTIPKRLTASSGAEAIWSSLIKTQANLLGAEHPLVYQVSTVAII